MTKPNRDSLDDEMNRMMNDESENHALIEGAGSISELIQALSQMKEIPGSQQVFSPATEITLILAVVQRKLGAKLEEITRTYGLRDKVEMFITTGKL